MYIRILRYQINNFSLKVLSSYTIREQEHISRGKWKEKISIQIDYERVYALHIENIILKFCSLGKFDLFVSVSYEKYSIPITKELYKQKLHFVSSSSLYLEITEDNLTWIHETHWITRKPDNKQRKLQRFSFPTGWYFVFPSLLGGNCLSFTLKITHT